MFTPPSFITKGITGQKVENKKEKRAQLTALVVLNVLCDETLRDTAPVNIKQDR